MRRDNFFSTLVDNGIFSRYSQKTIAIPNECLSGPGDLRDIPKSKGFESVIVIGSISRLLNTYNKSIEKEGR